MSTNTIPVLFIDGKATKVLKPLVGKTKKDGTPGNTYFATSKQAVMYGVKVSAKVLPNGRTSVFTLGIGDASPVAIPLSIHPKTANAVVGSVEVTIDGKTMYAEVYVKDHGNGTYQLRAKVTNKREANTREFTEDEIYV